jgi:stage V sporulation protein B
VSEPHVSADVGRRRRWGSPEGIVFAREAVLLAAVQTATTGCIFVTGVLVSRAQGPQGKGSFAMLCLAVALAPLVLSLGLGQAAIYFVRRSAFGARECAGNLLAVTLLITLGVLAPLPLLTAPSAYSWLKSVVALRHPWLLIVCIPPALARLYAGHLAAAIGDIRWYSLSFLLEAGLRLLCAVAILALGTDHDVGFAVLFGSSLAAIIAWYELFRRVDGIRPQLQWPLLRSLTAYGTRTQGAAILGYMNLKVDQLVVAIFLNLQSVGVYSVALSISELAIYVSRATSMVLFVRASGMSPMLASHATSRVARLSNTLAVFIAASIWTAAPTVVPYLFGDGFLVAVWPLRVLLFGTCALNLSQLLSSDLSARGNPSAGLRANVVGLSFMLAMDIALVPRFGLLGAAFASSLSYLIALIVLLVEYRRSTGVATRTLICATQADVVAAFTAIRGLVPIRGLA